jgi:hypothetical protein
LRAVAADAARTTVGSPPPAVSHDHGDRVPHHLTDGLDDLADGEAVACAGVADQVFSPGMAAWTVSRWGSAMATSDSIAKMTWNGQAGVYQFSGSGL